MPLAPGRDLTSIIQRQNLAAGQALARSVPSYSIPIADSKYTCPGYLFLGEYYYSYPDVMYPWDPAVVAAIREFEPTACPITIRSVWQKADYGNLETPFTLVRHGIARTVRDALIPTHSFHCETPAIVDPAYLSSLHTLAPVVPNYVEVNHYDRGIRPYGLDLPGAYLPFDWAFYHALRFSYENNRRPQDISADYINVKKKAKEQRASAQRRESDAIDREIRRDFSNEPSTPEWEAALHGPGEPAAKSKSFRIQSAGAPA